MSTGESGNPGPIGMDLIAGESGNPGPIGIDLIAGESGNPGPIGIDLMGSGLVMVAPKDGDGP